MEVVSWAARAVMKVESAEEKAVVLVRVMVMGCLWKEKGWRLVGCHERRLRSPENQKGGVVGGQCHGS